jgi:hypothetical protein
MAIENLYRPLWSEAILEELEYHESVKRIRRGEEPSRADELAGRLVGQMRVAFDDALVTGWEGLEGTYGLPDPDDEHVVATAVVGGAGAIVTENTKDFPPAKVPSHIQVLGACEFATNTVDVDPERAVRALREMARRRKHPPQGAHELLEILSVRYGMIDVAEILRPILE